MWILIARPELPDAPYWSGRHALAAVDALGWPLAVAWGVSQIKAPTGIFGSMIIALACLYALRRLHRAMFMNHRYRFTTWPILKIAVALLLVIEIIRLTLPVTASPGIERATHVTTNKGVTQQARPQMKQTSWRHLQSPTVTP